MTSCACVPVLLRVCLLHYDRLDDRAKRAARRAAGLR